MRSGRARSLRLGWAMLTLATTCRLASAAQERYGVDAVELRWLESQHAPAAAALLAGEALLARPGSVEALRGAETAFREGLREAPTSVLLARRHCQVLTALGKRDEAIDACSGALRLNAHSALVMRAAVGALMSGTSMPTPSQLGYAAIHAERVARSMPDEPWGAASECDIAAKLGDTDMLNRCLNTLRAVAPDHYETRRAEAAHDAAAPGWAAALQVLFMLSVGGTGLHVLLRRRRHAMSVAAAGILTASFIHSSTAHAAVDRAENEHLTEVAQVADEPPRKAGSLSRFSIDDGNPEGSVPTAAQRDKDPLEYGYFLMDLGDRADHAIQAGDHAGAGRFYRAMAKAVPDSPVGFVKACEQYELAGDLTRASELCAAALTIKGVKLSDYSHYAHIALSKPGPVADVDVSNLDGIVKHLTASDASRAVGLDIECTLGVRLSDRVRLSHCVPALATLAPDAPKTTFFAWALAFQDRDYQAMEARLAQARRTNATGADALGKEQMLLMERATNEALPVWRKGFRDWRFGAALSLALFAALFLLVSRRRAPEPETTASASGN